LASLKKWGKMARNNASLRTQGKRKKGEERYAGGVKKPPRKKPGSYTKKKKRCHPIFHVNLLSTKRNGTEEGKKGSARQTQWGGAR